MLGYNHPYHNDINGAGFIDFLKPLVPLIGPVVSAIGDLFGQHKTHQDSVASKEQLMQLYNEATDPKLKLEILKMINNK